MAESADHKELFSQEESGDKVMMRGPGSSWRAVKMPRLGLEMMGTAVKKLPWVLGKKGEKVKKMLLGPGRRGKVKKLMRIQTQTIQKDLSVIF